MVSTSDKKALVDKIKSLSDQNRKLITVNDGLVKMINDLRASNLQMKQEIAQLNEDLEWLEAMRFGRNEFPKQSRLQSDITSFSDSLMAFLKFLASFAAGVYFGIYINQNHEVGTLKMPHVVEYHVRQFGEYLRTRRDP